MDGNFVYNKPVTGKINIGRRTDSTMLATMLSEGRSVCIYEPAKTGKSSLLRQTFNNMKISSQQFITVELSLLNIRSISDYLVSLASALFKATGIAQSELQGAVARYLGGTHIICNAGRGNLTFGWELENSDIRAVLEMPYRLASDKGQKLVVVLDEYQNILLTEDGEKVCKMHQKILEGLEEDQRKRCSFVFVGSGVNAMKEIFKHKKYYFRTVDHLKLSNFEDKEIIEHILRGFVASGKVIDREMMLGVCRLFRGHIWYINHFAAICDSLSKGYMMEPILVEALGTLIAIHEPRFRATVDDLTTYQLSLLRAVLEGHSKLSSAEVISKYQLNSSANVKRLREALCKKEIITFNDKDEPIVLDPLFEYWAKKHFFNIE